MVIEIYATSERVKKKKGTGAPVHAMKEYRGSRGVALLILNLSTGCR
jgi:hypothetical protein